MISRLKSINVVIPVLGVLSLIVLAIPELGIIPMLIIIGIPISIAYWAIPAIFLITLITYVIYLLLPLKGWSRTIAALSGCAIILATPAYLLNRGIEKQARSYTSDDHDDLALPIIANKIAVRTKTSRLYWGRGVTRCDGFCLHALLTGSADSILVVETKDPHAQLIPDTEAVEFTIEKLPQCPPTKFTSGKHSLSLTNKNGSKKQRSANAIELMKLKISDGECLVTRKSKLSDADIVISKGRVISGVRYAARAGFDFSRNTISADRITVHQKSPTNDNFEQIYRWTGVRYKPFAWFLLPAPLFGYGFEMNMGWWRFSDRIGITAKYYESPNWPKFLTDTLGLNLYLDGEDTQKKILDKISNVLAEKRSPTKDEWDSFYTYFDRSGIGRNTNLNQRDFDIAYQILQSRKFPAPPRLYNIIRYAVKNGSPKDLTNLTDIIFTRMENASVWQESLGVPEKRELGNLAGGLGKIPDEYILPHFDRHVKLALNKTATVNASSLISKLHIYGERSVPILLKQIKIGLDGGKHFFREKEYQQPYLAGMVGLCLAGKRATSALPNLLELIQQRKLPAHSSYGGLLVNTLVRLGADPEILWAPYTEADKNRTRKHFDWEVRRASSDKPDCSF